MKIYNHNNAKTFARIDVQFTNKLHHAIEVDDPDRIVVHIPGSELVIGEESR